MEYGNSILFILAQIVILAYTWHVYKQNYTTKAKLLTIAFFCALEYILIIPMMPRPMPCQEWQQCSGK